MRFAKFVIGGAVAAAAVPLGALPAYGAKGGIPLKTTASGISTIDLVASPSPGFATGQGTVVGRFTETHLTSFQITGPSTFTDTGNSTVVAADGSELFENFSGLGTLTGVSVGSTIRQTITTTIAGGTGRFASATGTISSIENSVIAGVFGTTFTTQDEYTSTGTISL
jgi:hypothetical protein